MTSLVLPSHVQGWEGRWGCPDILWPDLEDLEEARPPAGGAGGLGRASVASSTAYLLKVPGPEGSQAMWGYLEFS